MRVKCRQSRDSGSRATGWIEFTCLKASMKSSGAMRQPGGDGSYVGSYAFTAIRLLSKHLRPAVLYFVALVLSAPDRGEGGSRNSSQTTGRLVRG